MTAPCTPPCAWAATCQGPREGTVACERWEPVPVPDPHPTGYTCIPPMRGETYEDRCGRARDRGELR
jgi:proteasome lid subunit RPN8/RPN11